MTVPRVTASKLAACRQPGRTAPVVGSSITDTGHVSATHNTIEWSQALAANGDPYYRKLGRDLLKGGESK